LAFFSTSACIMCFRVTTEEARQLGTALGIPPGSTPFYPIPPGFNMSYPYGGYQISALPYLPHEAPLYCCAGRAWTTATTRTSTAASHSTRCTDREPAFGAPPASRGGARSVTPTGGSGCEQSAESALAAVRVLNTGGLDQGRRSAVRCWRVRHER
jgi:hypothetical protein